MANTQQQSTPVAGTRLVTAKVAASYLGIRPKTLWEWVNRGVLPQVSIPGSKPKYDLRDLEKLIEKHKHFSGSDHQIVSNLISELFEDE